MGWELLGNIETLFDPMCEDEGLVYFSLNPTCPSLVVTMIKMIPSEHVLCQTMSVPLHKNHAPRRVGVFCH